MISFIMIATKIRTSMILMMNIILILHLMMIIKFGYCNLERDIRRF